MEVRLKKGARVKSSAEKIYTEMTRIAAKNGGAVDPEIVVEESRPEDAPLHDEFNWNDSEAAHQFRVEQARKVLQSVEVIREDTPPVRAFEAVTLITEDKEPPKKVYRDIESIMANPEARNELLAQAMRDAVAFRRRYHSLQEFSKLWQAMDDLFPDVDFG